MIRYLPVELILYISRILRNRQLFKIREKLDMDGVFRRHIVLVKYISKSKFYREPNRYSNRCPDVEFSTTVLFFKQDHIPDRMCYIVSHSIDLKTIRKKVAEMKGRVMLCY